MNAQDVIAEMTAAEYKEWVEAGKFPERLVPEREKMRKAARSKKPDYGHISEDQTPEQIATAVEAAS